MNDCSLGRIVTALIRWNINDGTGHRSSSNEVSESLLFEDFSGCFGTVEDGIVAEIGKERKEKEEVRVVSQSSIECRGVL